MDLNGLINESNKIVSIKSQKIQKNSKALRLPIPVTYMDIFDLKAGHEFDVLINKVTGGIYFQPKVRVEKRIKKETIKIRAKINKNK